MRRKMVGRLYLPIICAGVIIASCEKRSGQDSYLDLSMKDFVTGLKSKSPETQVPDTNGFILKIIDASGSTVYEGLYGARPEVISLIPGSCELSVLSFRQTRMAFDSLQYGDSKTLVVASGEMVSTSFMCKQVNSGIRLRFSESFTDRFGASPIVLRQNDTFWMEYPYTEDRIAYFPPGKVDLNLKIGSEENTLLSRVLNASEILTMSLSASGNDGELGMSIVIDTNRVWIYEEYVVGEGRDGSTTATALTSADFGLYAEAKQVWVKGYIAGGDVTSSAVVFGIPESETHLALSDIQNPSARSDCFAVELPTANKIRDSLSLKSHPDYLGKLVYIKGDIESYFGTKGVKNVKEYLFL